MAYDDQKTYATKTFRRTLSEHIQDDYWYHVELQQDGMIADWFNLYWKLAMRILTDKEIEYIHNMKSMTPEKLQKIILETEKVSTV